MRDTKCDKPVAIEGKLLSRLSHKRDSTQHGLFSKLLYGREVKKALHKYHKKGPYIALCHDFYK